MGLRSQRIRHSRRSLSCGPPPGASHASYACTSIFCSVSFVYRFFFPFAIANFQSTNQIGSGDGLLPSATSTLRLVPAASQLLASGSAPPAHPPASSSSSPLGTAARNGGRQFRASRGLHPVSVALAAANNPSIFGAF